MIKGELEGIPMGERPITLTLHEEDEEAVRLRVQDEQLRRNGAWLQAHWPELLPRARGKFLAVAGEQAFIADTPEEVWAQARGAHPDDRGTLVQYVRAERGPRLYATEG
jgi:hypothetical protein